MSVRKGRSRALPTKTVGLKAAAQSINNKPHNEIDLFELKRIIDEIFAHLINDAGVRKLDLPKDEGFYWEVPTDRLYAVQQGQPKLDVGRLSDDWEFLSAILKDKRQAVGFMLVHLAPILRYIGEQKGR